MMKTKTSDFELSFFEGVVSQRPDYIDALVPLSHAYTRLGLYEKSLEIDKRLAGLCKKDPVIHYNLACSYALSGQVRQSFTAVKKAVKLGFRDYGHMRKDNDLKLLRDHGPFKAWFGKMTASKSAVPKKG